MSSDSSVGRPSHGSPAAFIHQRCTPGSRRPLGAGGQREMRRPGANPAFPVYPPPERGPTERDTTTEDRRRTADLVSSSRTSALLLTASLSPLRSARLFFLRIFPLAVVRLSPSPSRATRCPGGEEHIEPDPHAPQGARRP